MSCDKNSQLMNRMRRAPCTYINSIAQYWGKSQNKKNQFGWQSSPASLRFASDFEQDISVQHEQIQLWGSAVGLEVQMQGKWEFWVFRFRNYWEISRCNAGSIPKRVDTADFEMCYWLVWSTKPCINNKMQYYMFTKLQLNWWLFYEPR